MTWLTSTPPWWVSALLYAVAAALLLYLVTPKEDPVTIRTMFAAAGRALARVVEFARNEPALAVAIATAAGDAFAAAMDGGLGPFNAARAAVIVGAGVLIRSRVTPTRKLPPPPPPTNPED